MPRFLVTAQISLCDSAMFMTEFVVVAPNHDLAFEGAHDYLTSGTWCENHHIPSAYPASHSNCVTVHDLHVRQRSAEQIACALTETRYVSSPKKKKEARHDSASHAIH